ncbi:hypothetical protein ACHAWU_003330 [Discostella pseudostelligera]|uniref:Uncharacterized protein n=1 Tax=Discostella pseudostelligera TaxID=259834 RepID=A0ABD3MK15_9STRA
MIDLGAHIIGPGAPHLGSPSEKRMDATQYIQRIMQNTLNTGLHRSSRFPSPDNSDQADRKNSIWGTSFHLLLDPTSFHHKHPECE